MYQVQFERDGTMARTLDAEEVCENHGSRTGHSSRLHADGWLITGYITEDYFYWVNAFEANHPAFGRVWGDFEELVCADSIEAYEAFIASHGPTTWDYWDI